MEINAEHMELIPHLRKQEMDQTFQGNASGESGVFSNGSSGRINASSSFASADSSWEFFQNEIVDPDIFDPPVKNSSGVVVQRYDCNLSTIEGVFASSKIGMMHMHVFQTLIAHFRSQWQLYQQLYEPVWRLETVVR